jgi:hypothetical protein
MSAILRDITGLVGIGLVSYGAWSWFAPAGFMVAGALLLAGSIFGTVRRR